MTSCAYRRWWKNSVAIELKRLFRPLVALLPLSLFLASLAAVSAQAQEPAARIVTRVAEQLPDDAAIWARPSQKSDLNNRLAEEFRLAIEGIGRAPSTGGKAPLYSLVFDGDVLGSLNRRDTTIGRIDGDAEGNLDFQLKLWSSGGGSSLFQGKGQTGTVSMRGFRLNAALQIGDKVIWQGYAATNTGTGDPFDTLAPLAQVLIDRLDVNTDEVIPLR